MKTYQISMGVTVIFNVFEFANSEQEAKEKVLSEHFGDNEALKKFTRDYLALCGDSPTTTTEIDDSDYWQVIENPPELWHPVFKSMKEKECA